MDKRRPVVVVQTDKVREPRVRSFLAVPLTSRLHLEGLPGNVRLDRRVSHLSRDSVANVYDLQKVFVADFDEPLTTLSRSALEQIEAGLRLVLDL
jgi:mRNA-degrading endonuclease toxin of MazEF toxin-antitoxin module